MTDYLNLTDDCDLTEEEAVSLARLVYDTDPFIYPAMFGNRQNAEVLLPLLFKRQDSMFRLSNCFVAVEERKIIGLLLWYRGQLQWTPCLLKQIAASAGIPTSPYLDIVAAEYFDSYNQDLSKSIISIINICVDIDHRERGIGRKMLETFVENENADIYQLCVLAENKNAYHLYESVGFIPIERYNGFSTDHHDVPAIRMERIKRSNE